MDHMPSWCLAWVACATVLSCLAAPVAERSATEKARDAVAAAAGLGESAPDWLVDSESYAIGYDPNMWESLAASKVAFITHCPVNADYFARAHALGIRCFPYVTFYQGSAVGTYEGVDLREHPEFIEVDANGNLVRTGFWDSEDAKNWYTTCPNTQAHQDAMTAWVERIMALGADGVFVDNLSHRQPCAGPKFGRHQHLYDDQDHAFAMLLKRVREVVQRHKPDGAMLGNSAFPMGLPKEFWAYLDAEMLESYICTWVSKDRWFDWQGHWHKQGVDLQPFLRAGKQIQCLSYLGSTPYGIREDAFFCYATARLAGMVWNGGVSLANPDSAILYQIRLGKPLGDEQEEDGVFYRVFERGFVAVNPNKEAAGTVTIKAPMPSSRLLDLAGSAPKGWASYPQGYDSLALSSAHDGERCLRISNIKPAESGVHQVITLNQAKPTPIVAGGWSRAENVSGAADPNYSVYLDITYGDGTYLFGQTADFTPGTHDWEMKQVVVKPEKPIKSLTVNVLCRYRTGTAWFDGIFLNEGEAPGAGANLVRNGGFEEVGGTARPLNAADSGGKVVVPPYSGRVYLFASDTADQLAPHGPKLSIVTHPALGEVRFRIDGFDFWTHSGHWTTEYVTGPEFGRFGLSFAGPGKHTVEVVDVVPSAMKTPAGYGSGTRLGEFMDPSQPTQPLGNRKFRFRAWAGAATSQSPKIELEVANDLTLTAEFDVEG
ncbi:MAG: hypothetical protein HYU66_20325 [Armatimonadetes bacterium]|nr:hypothetical protein [Armatimonadota bacterium]